LIFEDDTPNKLLKFAKTAVQYAQHDVDSNIVCFNRVILLHGPPGTGIFVFSFASLMLPGKTSLCKALAHKLAIRMRDV
jgi:hypothetical protein